MIVHNCIQKSDAWLKLRAGVPTASEFGQFMKADFTVRSGDGFNSYIAKKVAEKWLGAPLPQAFSSFDQEQGNILEDEAIPSYNFDHDCEIQRVGFVTMDNLRAGCSPDGLLDDVAGYEAMVKAFSKGCAEYKCAGAKCGIEVKCPKIETHVGYLLSGKLPSDYAAQVHGSMHVTGASEWKFMSYRRNFPNFILTIERDEKIQTAITESLTAFWESFDNTYKKLLAINGGVNPNESKTLDASVSDKQTTNEGGGLQTYQLRSKGIRKVNGLDAGWNFFTGENCDGQKFWTEDEAIKKFCVEHMNVNLNIEFEPDGRIIDVRGA